MSLATLVNINTNNLAANANIASSQQATETKRLQVKLSDLRVHDAVGTVLPGTAAADDLALVGGTFGTNPIDVQAGDVKATSSTRYARFAERLPPNYKAGGTITLRMHAGMKTTVADTSCDLDAEVYQSDLENGVGSDLCATNAQPINSLTFADKDFVVTPTGLVAGDVLDVRIAVAYVDAATGTAVIPVIGSIELRCQTQG